MRTHTAHTRDAALRQLRRANRWMIAGSVALTGVLIASWLTPATATAAATAADDEPRHEVAITRPFFA